MWGLDSEEESEGGCGDSIIRKTDRAKREDDVVVCFPGTKVGNITGRVEKTLGPGKGGCTLVHVRTTNT